MVNDQLIKENIMNDPIDQLKEWWENAEDAPASPGDLIIERHVCERDEDTYYTVGAHREGMRGLIGKSGTRILERAPKPAWHDAVAVIASVFEAPREVFTNLGDGKWESLENYTFIQQDLIDPVPLIEAKVTDEMVLRALNEKWGLELCHLSLYNEDAISVTRDMLSAALGIDTE